jgi:hypothetical protein
MTSKIAITFAAAAALGLASLGPTAALAKGHGGGGHGGHGGHGGVHVKVGVHSGFHGYGYRGGRSYAYRVGGGGPGWCYSHPHASICS